MFAVDCVVLEKFGETSIASLLKDIDIYSVNYPQDYRRMFHFNFNFSEFSLKDMLKMVLILVLCTLIAQGLYALSILDYDTHNDLYIGNRICIYMDKWVYL